MPPISIRFWNQNVEKALEYAKLQSYTTHDGEEAAECSRLLTFILHNLFRKTNIQDSKNFLETIGETFKSDNQSVQCLAKSIEEETISPDVDPISNKILEDRNWNWLNPEFKYSPTRSPKTKTSFIGVYCMDALAMALHISYHANSFKEAILKAVNLGGDADTVAAICGMITGAIFGYDSNMQNWYLKYILKWDDFRVPIRAYKLYKLSENLIAPVQDD